MTHSMKEWMGGLGRAIQIYLPVHFLPALIFKFQRLQSTPLATTARIAYAALCSSAFLTSYQVDLHAFESYSWPAFSRGVTAYRLW